MNKQVVEAEGKQVLPYLAQRFQQLYLKPEPEGNPLYRSVVLAGEDAPSQDLSHFVMDERDSCVLLDTPAGSVRAVTLHQRSDFETALNCIAMKTRVTEIPATQGASILDGVISWPKIKAHEEEYRKTADDWDEEFGRFTKDKKNYTEALILLSYGPYSAVKPEAVGYDPEAWNRYSDLIRRYHECTHFVCRRLFPDQIHAIWDELAADAAGILAAFGSYDRAMAEVFLGIEGEHYTKGRLENYVEDKDPEKLNQLAKEVHGILLNIETLLKENTVSDVFETVILLEEHQKEFLKDTSLAQTA